ncbi:uncharacterized protein PV07_12616 [Cladophialophora immunda]|uniref:Uncharacterized protein n=1 Tax=Cladophialophora immunda TaxID=569365 RepID=A0A0D2CEN2_9EURO|nr:uncharacterized protein PV07_12616 [Cladophialophora immunda]KIW21984.1 hypothetical protein PV07_12616 [Cladophialophora immunda]
MPYESVSYDFEITTGGLGTKRHQAFMKEFENTGASRSYTLKVQDDKACLTLKSMAPLHSSGIPEDFMALSDWWNIYGQNISNDVSKANGSTSLGVYQGPDGQNWIDGSWTRSYGEYNKEDRNKRVQQAQQEYPGAKIHADPYACNFKLIG